MISESDSEMSMSDIQAEIIESMKTHLLGRVEDWVGRDLPAEGSEDYETWQSRLAEIDSIENILDVIDYVESEGLDLNEFLLTGKYQAISAGLDPSRVPSEVFKDLGILLAEQTWSGGSWVSIYSYDGKYFVSNEVETSIADTEAEAFRLGGIDNDSFDEILHSKVSPPTPAAQNPVPRTNKLIFTRSKRTQVEKRAVLIVVTDWPDGTMAFKFGAAIQAALGVSEGDMNLVQMAPERIFRVETSVSEAGFRGAMGVIDVASGGSVLFVEIPKV